MTDHPLPAAGGSYIRDPETGELTPVLVTRPAPRRGEEAEPDPAPEPGAAPAPDAAPKPRKSKE